MSRNMKLFQPFIIFLISLSIFISKCFADKNSSHYRFVKYHQQLTNLTLHICEEDCRRDKLCAGWKVVVVSRTSETGFGPTYDCYFETPTFIRLSRNIPHIFNDTMQGYKLSAAISLSRALGINSTTLRQLKNSVSNSIKVNHLIKGPVGTDHTSVINFQEHFVKGCDYTISLWVWLWKMRKPAPLGDHQIIIHSMILPHLNFPKAMEARYSSHDQTLYPTIIINANPHPNKFFFGIEKEINGDEKGLWPKVADVNYRQWIHFTLTIKGNLLKIYMNGTEIDYLYFEKESNMLNLTCPYTSEKMVKIKTRRKKPDVSKTTEPIAENESLIGNLFPIKSADKSASDSFKGMSYQVDDPWATYINNTLLHAMGARSHRGTPGMIQDLIVIRNKALNAQEVIELMKFRPVKPMPTLYKLIDGLRVKSRTLIDGIFSKSIIETANVSSDWYEDSIIKSMLPKKAIVLHANNSATAPRESSALDSFSPDSENSIDNTGMLSSTTSLVSEVKTFPRKTSWSSPIFNSVSSISSKHGKSLSIALSRAKSAAKAMVESAWHSLSLLSPSQSLTIKTESNKKNVYKIKVIGHVSEAVTKKKNTSKDNNGNAIDLTEKINSDIESQVQSLYKAAMIWKQGRDADSATLIDTDSNLPLSIHGNDSQSSLFRTSDSSNTEHGAKMFAMTSERFSTLDKWSKTVAEKSTSALLLAMWLCDDIRSPKDNNINWGYLYSSLLAQPIKIALAYESGFGSDMNIFHPEDAAQSSFINQALGGIPLTDLFINNYQENTDRPSHNVNPDVSSAYRHRRRSMAQELAGRIKFENTMNSTQWLELFGNLSDDNINEFFMASTHNFAGLDSQILLCKPLLESSGLNLGLIQQYLSEVNETFDLSSEPSSNHNEVLELQNSTFSSSFVDYDDPHHVAALNETTWQSALTQSLFISRQSVLGCTECQAAASYYFPISNYVVSHFGEIDSGVGYLQNVDLFSVLQKESRISGYGGEGDELQVSLIADARNGVATAQTWLAKRYFWGWGGLQRNEELARYWFEQAAAQQEAEALYNIGTFYMYGNAGYPLNETAAVEHFRKSAEAENPFPMAIHAMGNHYFLYSFPRNYTLARMYYTKAANYDNPNGHFSLAMMLKDGLGGNKDIPLAVLHLALASNAGHVRSMDFLAHALYDQESWLAIHGREQEFSRRSRSIMHTVDNPTSAHAEQKVKSTQTISTSPNSTTSSTVTNITLKTFKAYYSDLTTHLSKVFFAKKVKEKQDMTIDRWKYNPHYPISIFLGDDLIQLPHPLGSGGNSPGSCKAAMSLLKYISEMSYRSNDLVKGALLEFLSGNYWEALELYEEAAELGVVSAQRNSIYIYSLLRRFECVKLYIENVTVMDGVDLYNKTLGTTRTQKSSIGSIKTFLNTVKSAIHKWYKAFDETRPENVVLSDLSIYLEPIFAEFTVLKEATIMSEIEGKSCSGLSSKCRNNSSKVSCELYFDRVAARRWIQLMAHDDLNAVKTVADILSTKTSSEMSGMNHNCTQAALLLSYAAERGDSESMINLGFLIREGKCNFKRNSSAADFAFTKAQKMEFSNGRVTGTHGIAPLAGKALLWYDYISSLCNNTYVWYLSGGKKLLGEAEVGNHRGSQTDRSETWQRIFFLSTQKLFSISCTLLADLRTEFVGMHSKFFVSILRPLVSMMAALGACAVWIWNVFWKTTRSIMLHYMSEHWIQTCDVIFIIIYEHLETTFIVAFKMISTRLVVSVVASTILLYVMNRLA